MSSQLLKLTHDALKILGIGPKSNKIYSFLLLTTLTLLVILSSIDRPYLKSYTYIKLVVSVLMDFIAYFFNFWTILFSRSDFFQQFECDNEPKLRHYLIFIFVNVFFWVIILMSNYAFTRIILLKSVLEIVIIDIEIYSQFLYGFMIYLILDTIKSKYRQMHRLLANYKVITSDEFFYLVSKIESLACELKNTVDDFNDIFGISFLLIISYSTLHFVNYIDDLFFFRFEKSKFEPFLISNISLVSLIFLFNCTLIIMCDCVRSEASKVVKNAQKLRHKFDLKTLVLNFPKFTAGGFFHVKKSTIFSILNTVSTLLIVMVQFDKER
ncbi:gustatory receptor isoform X1 [Tribolium castaneum]|uniref:Gustatory receptor n=1 Tax=Tribolium castaneum TaxID=7070 RepID=A2AX96_TRICA|nr:gustatory receptor [Tribolium castaneum]ABY40604.1 gustatory receptor [Tribolium castaneum]EFA05773.1 gustatory receptor 48 [Tribolium castaneum]CAL23167.1 gustatory receptor candidate 34 [Tribolium castaneum]|eukprot:NP_001137598.1 gustatory receptor [Tribolium castaneum]